MNTFVKTLASFFGIGFLKPCPGTWGSLAGLAVALAWPAGLLPTVLILSLAGFFLSAPARAAFGSEDPQAFVLDEVCGMMAALVGLPLNPVLVTAAFILFRIADTVKPWPIILFQRMKSPLGIMADDLAAGILVNLLLQVVLRFVI